ncbi:RHS repeat-associated core domain-containing protein [Pseudomonas fluorescens]|nr:RHS repeat-associated core domain-containing protein [Pseudomonas fluorescens]
MVGSNNKEQLAPSETAVSFHYDALDTLIGRDDADGKEQRFYRNGELATEIQGAVSGSFVRAEGIVLAEHRSGAGIQSLLLAGNDKNSVLCEVSQEAIRGIAYSPYGHRVAGSPVNSHLGYNGERRETQSGWYLLGNGYRVFNPLLMRFHSPDNLSPFGKGGLNAYMYCVGDPVNNIDPTGHSLVKFLFRRRGASSPPVPVAKMSGSLLGTEDLPKSFLRSKSGEAGSEVMGVITPKHVKHLARRKIFYEIDFANQLGDYALLSTGGAPQVKIRPMAHSLSREAMDSAASDLKAAQKRLGKLGITKTSKRDFEIISKAFKKGIATRSWEEQIRFFERLQLGEDEMKKIRGIDS